MASNDLRDVLNLPSTEPSSSHSSHPPTSRPSKKSRTAAAPRPNLKGLAREVQSLGGDTPIAIVPEVSVYKKRRLINRKPAAKWELRPFRNSARDDPSLILRHWRRKPEEEEGSASKGAQQQQQQKQQQEQADTNGDASAAGSASTATPTENGHGANGRAPAAEEIGEQQNGTGDDNNSGNTTNANILKPEPEIEDSSFAKFNVQVQVPEYNDEQYDAHFLNEDWSKEETDYLFELVRDFHLRWPLIWDRFDYVPKPHHHHNHHSSNGDDMDIDGSITAIMPAPKKRTMEDLKKRYYDVAAKMMEIQKPKQYMTQFEWDIHTMMLNFDPDKEAQRKRFALNTMARTEAEAKEEESLLIEVKRIMARAERFSEERRELYQRLEYPPSDQDISAFKGSAGLTQLLAQLQTQSQARKRKPIAGPETAGPAGAAPNAQPSSAVSETASNRRESVATTQPAASHRETANTEKSSTASGAGAGAGSNASTSGAAGAGSNGAAAAAAASNNNNNTTTTTNKKGQPPPERRKLSDYEEQIYGVSSHERLSSGPTFRYDRVNKLFSHKSGQQQHRIQTVLNELNIPARLNMPTATVVAEYEKLVLAVTSLVDLRKQKDKIENEIRIEDAKKVERVKARKQALGLDGDEEEESGAGATEKEGGGDDATAEGGGGDANKKATIPTPENEPAETNGDTDKKQADDTQSSRNPPPQAPAATSTSATDKDAPSTSADASPNNSKKTETAHGNGDGDGKPAEGDDNNDDNEAGSNDNKAKANNTVVKQEDGARPGSSGSGSHKKRSASVLSAGSDKSAKRQKK
ncbi:hypothetical protein BD289DRAFT_442980 [Coniella lustricola]|uniref:SWR1-complex protein 4 n=1 Tax=Coniella lustricola TaxID=2025994 RepID=A0A2T2ZXN2_9PEZI|nr:hypothetical protein BD289DRAFT_442980 [Coniella lustricola]